ncbi:MAG: hypothetical protein AB1540_16685 [Bdellovibrionota bacterium]
MKISQYLRTARTLFFALGLVAILVGAGIAAYSVFELRPQMSALSTQLERNLELVERTASVVQENDLLPLAAVDGAQAARRVVGLLPATLDSMEQTLLELSRALATTGRTAQETKEGVAGIVLPNKELEQTHVSLKKTSIRLRGLAHRIESLKQASAEFAKATEGFSNGLAQVQSSIGSTSKVLNDVRVQIQGTQKAIAQANLPLHITLLGIGFGGIYILLGCFSLGFGLACSGIAQNIQASEAADAVHPPSQRAA